MNRHAGLLAQVCRVGGKKLASTSHGTLYPVAKFRPGVKLAFGIDVSEDDAAIHPPYMCSTCQRSVCRVEQQPAPVADADCTEGAARASGCGSPVLWQPHRRKHCSFCASMEERAKGGRPQKKQRSLLTGSVSASAGTATSTAASATSSSKSRMLDSGVMGDGTSSEVGLDEPVESVRACATPDYKVGDKDLCPERFSQPFVDLKCSVCLHIVNQANESVCCKHVFCCSCICHWLRSCAL